MRSCWVVLSLLMATSVWAQTPRDSVLVNTNGTDDARGIGLSSRDELTAILWNEGGSTNQVFVSTSDGRGLTWSDPVRVDEDDFSKTTQEDGVFVSSDNVYVVWEANQQLFFNRSTDRGATFGTPNLLDVGPGTVADWRVSCSPDLSGDHIYVLSSTTVTSESVFLVASHDGGSTFGAAVPVSSDGSGDVDGLALCADGMTVHIVWDDDRSGSDTVYYQRSSDGGMTFMVQDVELGDNVGIEDSQDPLSIAFTGSTVAVAWEEEPAGAGNEVLQVNVSADGGSTFHGPMTVGSYVPGVHDTDGGDVGVDPVTGHVLVTWEDDRTGQDEAYCATSVDLGLSFGLEHQCSVSGAQNPRIKIPDSGFDNIIVIWESTEFPSSTEASLTRDGGATWDSIVVSDNIGFVDVPTAGYNGLYNNFILAWAALDETNLKVFGGGFRPQTLTPVEPFTAGEPANFAVVAFPPSELNFEFGVLISGDIGSFTLPLGDGRSTGLANDNFLSKSKDRIPGLLSGVIQSDGGGATPVFPFPPNVTVGTSFYCVAVAFSRDGGNITVGSMTDVAIVTVE